MITRAVHPHREVVTVTRIIFEESPYYILQVEDELAGKAIAKGEVPPISIVRGNRYRLSGTWCTHKEHGEQLQITMFEPLQSSELAEDEFVAFLSGPAFHGIGVVKAEAVLSAFGLEEAKHVISHNPERLATVPGISLDRALAVTHTWNESEEVMKVLARMRALGIAYKTGMRVYDKYGDGSMSVIEDNPFTLMYEMEGFGFLKCDKIASELHFSKDDRRRVEACTAHQCQEMTRDGSTCTEAEKVITRVFDITRASIPTITDAIGIGRSQGHIVQEGEMLFFPGVYDAERRAAEMLGAMYRRSAELLLGTSVIDAEHDITISAQSHGLKLSQGQLRALLTVFNNPSERIVVVTGGPGSGKTTMLKVMGDVAAVRKHTTVMLAPTGRAAQRIRELTGHEARTIHSFALGRDSEYTGLSNDCIIVIDEASMMDVSMLGLIALKMRGLGIDDFRIVLIGDTDQLPSVGPGNLLRDLIAYLRPRRPEVLVNLTTIFRFQRGGGIFALAETIRAGRHANIKKMEDSRIHTRVRRTPDAIRTTVVEAHNRLTQQTSGSFIILAPMYRGAANIDDINQSIQDGNKQSEENTMKFGGGTQEKVFKLNDRVIQTINRYEFSVFNGEIGRVCEIQRPSAENSFDQRAIVVAFPSVDIVSDDRRIRYTTENITDIKLAYAISIHRSQGSEVDTVVLVLRKAHYFMLFKELVYTAITRARDTLLIVGDPEAYYMALNKVASTGRTTMLYQWLKLIEEHGEIPPNEAHDIWVSNKIRHSRFQLRKSRRRIKRGETDNQLSIGHLIAMPDEEEEE